MLQVQLQIPNQLVPNPIKTGLQPFCPVQDAVGAFVHQTTMALKVRDFRCRAVQFIFHTSYSLLGFFFLSLLSSQLFTCGLNLTSRRVQLVTSCFKLGIKDALIGLRTIYFIARPIFLSCDICKCRIRLPFDLRQSSLQQSFSLLERSLEQLDEIRRGAYRH